MQATIHSATISREEISEKINRGEPLKIVETLPESTFRKHHLPGALNLPLDRLQELAPKLLPDKQAEIVVYCANTSCDASARAAHDLARLGYTHVRKYAGGKQDWMDAGLPTETGSTMYAQSRRNGRHLPPLRLVSRRQSSQRSKSVNVGEYERWASVIGGGTLALYGLARRSLGGLALAGLGGSLIYRGATGHCSCYETLGISTADQPV